MKGRQETHRLRLLLMMMMMIFINIGQMVNLGVADICHEPHDCPILTKSWIRIWMVSHVLIWMVSHVPSLN